MKKPEITTIRGAIVNLIEKDRVCAIAILLATLSICPHIWDGMVSMYHDYATGGAHAQSLTSEK